jgi:HK97 family phage major capsid protein
MKLKQQIDELNSKIAEAETKYRAFSDSLPDIFGEDAGQRTAKMEGERKSMFAELDAMYERKISLEEAYKDELKHRAMMAEMSSSKGESGATIRDAVTGSGIQVADKPIYAGPLSFARACQDIAFGKLYSDKRGDLARRNLEKYVERQINMALQSRAAGSPSYKESVWEDGGIWMETEKTTKMIDNAYNNSVVLARADRRTMTGAQNKLDVIAVNETSRKDGSRAGIRWYPEHELDELTASKSSWDKVSIEAIKLMAGTFASNEILEDVGMMAGEINRLVGNELNFALQVYAFEGIGAPDPMLGLMNSPAKIEVAKTATQGAGTVVVENIFAMKSRLWLAGLQRAEWYYNRELEPQFRQLVIPTGTASGQLMESMWQPARDGKSAYLDGIPAYSIEQCEIPGTPGDLVLNVPGEYLTITKGGMDAMSSMHVHFLQDQMTFRFKIRVGGMSLWKKALTPYKGTTTTSPIVTLAVRS